MDNLLLTKTGEALVFRLINMFYGRGFFLEYLISVHPGKLFHIDFGYILGRDPKPLPPPMKLSKEMVEGMGGMQSEQYQEFRKQCYTAFLHLRR